MCGVDVFVECEDELKAAWAACLGNVGEQAPCHRMYGLLTKCEVKMAGYWPSSFFACLWTETASRSINTQKTNEANIKPS